MFSFLRQSFSQPMYPEHPLPFSFQPSPRWSSHETLSLPTSIQGRLLEDWAARLQRRWGQDAAEQIRQDTQDALADLPDAPHHQAKIPIGVALCLLEAIADRFLNGDLDAYSRLIEEAFTSSQSLKHRMMRGILASMTPSLFLHKAASAYREAYDQGHATLRQERDAVLLRFEGAQHHDHPTWQSLQVIAIRSLLQLMRRHHILVQPHAPAPHCFEMRISWR